MRILLDTSFLLPSLGVEVAGAAETLESLKENEFYYLLKLQRSRMLVGFNIPRKAKSCD